MKGLIHFEFLTITTKNCEELQRLKRALEEKCLSLISRGQVLFHQATHDHAQLV